MNVQDAEIRHQSLLGTRAKKSSLEEYNFYKLNFEFCDVDKIPLDERFFNFICKYPKFPLMKNKRKIDPIIQQIVVEDDVSMDTSYGLPKPNLEASYKSLNKYGKPQPIFDDAASIFASRCLEKHFGPYMRDSEILSYEEALAQMDTKTSPGFPWNINYSKKTDLIKDIPNEFREYAEKVYDEFLLKDDYYFIFVNSLKEEIRPIEKIKMNKIRTFTASPIEAVNAGYRLFGDMNLKFYESHLRTASAVGLCPFYGGWDELYRKLKNHPKTNNPIAYELDESEFDSSLSRRLFEAILQFRWNMLKAEFKTPENYARMRNYYKNIVNSVIITADGNIVQKQTGNPSGSVNTISDNTFILFWLLAYAWYILAPISQRTYEEFIDSVIMALQGDDNTWTVDEETNEFYNAKTVSQEFSKIGITTTSPSYEPRRLEEVEFLSSSFSKFVRGMCVYNLDPEKLIESLKWTQYPGDPVMTLTRLAAILRVTWPEKEMRELCRKIMKYMLKRYDGVMSNTKDWQNMKAQFLSDSEFLNFYIGCGEISEPSHIKRMDKEFELNIEIPVEIAEAELVHQARKKKAKKQAPARKKMTKVKKSLKKEKRKNNRLKRRPKKIMVNAPAACGYIQEMSKPELGGRRAVIVKHREFIADINGTVAFNALSFDINPGLSTTFPWLSNMAPLFEQYRFKKLSFDYEATQSTTKIGSVILTTDYDAAESAPTTKVQAMDYYGATRGQAWTSFSHRLKHQSMTSYLKRYVRSEINPTNTDIKTYDVGKFYICTVGQDNTNQIGELYVDYVVEFFTPQLSASMGVLGGRINGAGTFTNANLLGNAGTLDSQASGLSYDSSTGIITVSNAGTYVLNVNAAAASNITITNPSGWTAIYTTGAQLNAAASYSKALVAGETIGPIAATGGVATSSVVVLTRTPAGSVQLTDKVLNQDALIEQLTKILQERFCLEPNVEKGFVKLPKLSRSKSKKVLEEESDEETPSTIIARK